MALLAELNLSKLRFVSKWLELADGHHKTLCSATIRSIGSIVLSFHIARNNSHFISGGMNAFALSVKPIKTMLVHLRSNQSGFETNEIAT